MTKFDNMTKLEQRVVIAKDLLARLRRRRFTAKSAVYLAIRGIAKDETDARKALKESDCRGCQIGGLFICALDRHNKLELPDVGLQDEINGVLHANDRAMRAYLKQWFSYDEMDAVEGFFEGFDKPRGAIRFVELVDDPARRMRMIAQNIVDGNGRFSATRLMETARARAK